MGKRVYGDTIVEKRDPGEGVLLDRRRPPEQRDVPGSDLEAIEDGYISVTPIHLDLTNYAASGLAEMDLVNEDVLRRRMVEEQIRRRGIRDERVLSVMEEVPRHLFIPKEIRQRAYADEPFHRRGADDLPAVHRRRDDAALRLSARRRSSRSGPVRGTRR